MSAKLTSEQPFNQEYDCVYVQQRKRGTHTHIGKERERERERICTYRYTCTVEALPRTVNREWIDRRTDKMVQSRTLPFSLLVLCRMKF